MGHSVWAHDTFFCQWRIYHSVSTGVVFGRSLRVLGRRLYCVFFPRNIRTKLTSGELKFLWCAFFLFIHWMNVRLKIYASPSWLAFFIRGKRKAWSKLFNINTLIGKNVSYTIIWYKNTIEHLKIAKLSVFTLLVSSQIYCE